ncbi:hypothetical protein LMH87_002848 [Akanthomyces muscarius]|uniref:Uncharacterized protein n=1 Tax=Akanthomyces muscarius TaxID=2231603 RepID=A0A9W8UK26_AKAMU|nr:hypothetical protein LMH87_002848 [Akanthomyces muscarius]KAJ4148373.1 hypothetical protein LMH87_002848 [Akanthomyces muscarius]
MALIQHHVEPHLVSNSRPTFYLIHAPKRMFKGDHRRTAPFAWFVPLPDQWLGRPKLLLYALGPWSSPVVRIPSPTSHY